VSLNLEFDFKELWAHITVSTGGRMVSLVREKDTIFEVF
jgi:hypothetical protein